MKCPYVHDYTCDDCRYCKTEPYKKGGLDNWNMLEKTKITVSSNSQVKEYDSFDDFIDDFDKEFISKHENRIISDERIFENGLDGGLLPTSESLTKDFNRIFGTNYKNIFPKNEIIVIWS